MTASEKFQELINHNRFSEIPKRVMYLAYLEMHMENPGMHPDDYLSLEGGYEGWHVLLTHMVLTSGTGNFPDTFHYPCAFLRSEAVLETFESFHADDTEDMEYLGYIASLQEFLSDFDTKQIQYAAECAMKLYLFHATEDEDNQPVNDLRDISDVLTWISQFK